MKLATLLISISLLSAQPHARPPAAAPPHQRATTPPPKLSDAQIQAASEAVINTILKF